MTLYNHFHFMFGLLIIKASYKYYSRLLHTDTHTHTLPQTMMHHLFGIQFNSMRWFVSRQSVSCDCLFRCCRVLLQPDCHCCCPQPIVHYSSVSTKINARKKFYFRYDKLNIDKVHVLNPRIVFNENKIARESNRIAIGRARAGEGRGEKHDTSI